MSSSIAVTEKENVIIAAGLCSLTLLPKFGAKIASLRVHRHELLQQPLAPIAPRTHSMTFDAGDASGWDECLPSVAACTVPTPAGDALVPDHGDLWRVAWDTIGKPHASDVSGQAISLAAQCFSLPLRLYRDLELRETTHGWQLNLDYRLSNTGDTAVPWSWAAHPLFTVELGDRILLPDSVQSLRLEGSAGARLGQSGDMVNWPIANLASGGATDLQLAQPPGSGIGEKLFAGPLGATEGWCVLHRPSVGLRLRVRFDPDKTPYLGLWICYGGWPGRPGPKQVCVAMEPATAPVDSLAVTGPWSRTLAPGESCTWPMHLDIESL
jgi:galactose mutarotase-like enzyme